MKKKILVILTGAMLFGVAGCGVTEQLVEDAKEDIVLFCTLDDAPLVRLNGGVSAWIARSFANYLWLFEQFI